MPSLSLQKPPMNFKTKEHLRGLVRGMQSCLKGDFGWAPTWGRDYAKEL